MPGPVLIIVLLAFTAVAFQLGRRRAFAMSSSVGGTRHLHSLPSYYGSLTALWCTLPALLVFGLWMAFESQIVESLVVSGLPETTRALPPQRLNLVVNDIRNLAEGNIVSGEVVPEMRAAADHYLELRRTAATASAVVVLAIAVAGLGLAWRRISPVLRARNQVEQIVRLVLIASSTVAIFTTVGIVLSVLFEAILFFGHVGITDFLFGLDWSPQMAIREDQVGSSGAFGAIPLFAGTLLISFIAMLIAAPVGLFAAIYLVEYATPAFRSVAKPILEILAGIPTVVYGFFAALIVAPVIRDTGGLVGLDVASESALAAGLVMGGDDHPLRIVAVRRRDQRRTPGAARRLLRARRDPLGDDPAGRPASRPARYRGRPAARDLARHRRDDDRGDGGRSRREPDRESAPGGDHGDGADRHPAGG